MPILSESAAGWTETLGEHAGNPPTPRSSGESIYALGQTWTISSCEQRIKAQFEQWVRGNAKRGIAETDREEGPEAASQMRSAFIGDRGAGFYTWGGRHIRNALNDVPGIRHVLFLLLRRCHPEVTEQQAQAVFLENPRGASEAIRWALGNSETPATPGTTSNGKTTEPKTLDGNL